MRSKRAGTKPPLPLSHSGGKRGRGSRGAGAFTPRPCVEVRGFMPSLAAEDTALRGERMRETVTKWRTKSVRGGKQIRLAVNGQPYLLTAGKGIGEVDPAHTLSHTLRETLGLKGTKLSCESGACGACTVLMDGKAVLSCMLLTIECGGKEITTIEGLKDEKTGALHPLQQSFIDHGAFQCGFCTPGMIMSAKALLDDNPSPGEEEIKEALSGNFCRCISNYQVVEAVKAVSGKGR